VCRCRDDAKQEQDNYAPMVYQGFEADRDSLKYRCPAAVRGIACTQRDLCHGGRHTDHGRIVRVPIDTDRRLFTPLARDSKTWHSQYDHRTAVERVNGRIDGNFGFERHTIRGLNKMRLRVGLALVIILALAKGWLERGHPERIRSLLGRPRPKKRARPRTAA